MSFDELDTLLNKRSGLLGISGLTNDMRELLAEESENQDRRARLAIDIFCLRIKKYIGAYLAANEWRRRHRLHRRHRRKLPRNPPPHLRRPRLPGHHRGPGKNEELTAGREGEIGAEGARVRLYRDPHE